MEKNQNLNIKFGTLNCWGLKFISKCRKERLQDIGKIISESNYDIIALQEVWVEDDIKMLIEITRNCLKYYKIFHSGILAGPGLMILSRFPILTSHLYKYPLNGRPSAIHRGDWYVGKSVGSVEIFHPYSGRTIEVFNTHLHAPYADNGDASYECHRTSQAWDLSHMLLASHQKRNVVVAVGDFNFKPGTLPFELITNIGRVADAWTYLHDIKSPQQYKQIQNKPSLINESILTKESFTPEKFDNYSISDSNIIDSTSSSTINTNEYLKRPLDCVRRNSVTTQIDLWQNNNNNNNNIDNKSNILPITNPPSSRERSRSNCSNASVAVPSVPCKDLTAHIGDLSPEDQIIKAGVTCNSRLNTWRADRNPNEATRLDYVFFDPAAADVNDIKVVFTDKPHGVSLSDHFGVCVDMTIRLINVPTSTVRRYSSPLDAEYPTESKAQLRTLYAETAQVINKYKSTASLQSKLRSLHFVVSIFAIVGILIGEWFIPHHASTYSSFLLTLASVTIAVTGTVNGIIGYLFGRAEWRGLMEFEDQVAMADRALSFNIER